MAVFPPVFSFFFLSFFPDFSSLDSFHAFQQDGVLKWQFQDGIDSKTEPGHSVKQNVNYGAKI